MTKASEQPGFPTNPTHQSPTHAVHTQSYNLQANGTQPVLQQTNQIGQYSQVPPNAVNAHHLQQQLINLQAEHAGINGVQEPNLSGNLSNHDDERLSVSGSLESVTSFAQTRVNDHKRPNLVNLKREILTDDHKLSLEQLAKKYETNLVQGLSKAVARARLLRCGPNSLSPGKQVSEFYRFMKTLFSGFSLLLWIGALLCVGASIISGQMDHLILGATLAVVVLATGLFSFFQERKSSRIMDSFKKLMPSMAQVIRDSQRDTVEASELVVGDLVEVSIGDRVPADIRLVKVQQLRVDNSSLTGESEPQTRSIENTNDNPLETKNLAFYSTHCVDGSGMGIVVATGDRTMMGQIAGLTAQLETGETPIAREIDHFIKLITITACSIGVIFFILALLCEYNWLEAVVFLIGIIVANVPEGLLATVTVCLTLTAKRMAARQCLVKNLEAVETLGSCSVICSDKTGTLTKNTMSVSHCWYDNHMFKCEVHDSRRARLRDANSLAWHSLTRAAKLCSRARFRPNQDKVPIRRRKTTGDASESAILKWMESEFGQVVEFRDRQQKVAEITFNSTNKYALSIYDLTEQRRQNSQALTQAIQQQSLLRSRSNSSSSSARIQGKGQQAQQQQTSIITNSASSHSGESAVTGTTISGNVGLSTTNNSLNTSRVGSATGQAPIIKRLIGARPGTRTRTHYKTSDDISQLIAKQELDKLDSGCRYLLIMKGAPERVLERCDKILCANEVRPLDSKMRENFVRAYESMGGLGERVMGFADLPLIGPQYSSDSFRFESEPKPNFPLVGLRFLGLVSMIDPPRASVPDAVAQCRDAGIRIIMITGDHPITAQAIARSVGIFSDSSETLPELAKRLGQPVDSLDPKMAAAAVVHGNELREMSSSQLDEILSIHPELVFARTSPQQKLIIVEACQRAGSIVAVTGDGVNDSPALKKADIGIAMGVNGSDVSKQAADMILLDDNFASIVKGIEEGRLIFDNLKKSISYTICSNVPELLPFLVYVVAGIPLGLSTVCILLIDIVTDMAPAISLAYEKAETDIMRRRPRNPKRDRLVTWRLMWQAYGQTGIIQAAAGFFAYFVIFNDHGWSPSSLQGITRSGWDNRTIASNGDPEFTSEQLEPFTMVDSYGFPWTYEERKRLEHTVQTAFFVTIVVMQWGDLVLSKTRKLSILQQGMDNHVLNFSLILETALTVMVVYVPFMKMFDLYPVGISAWLLGIPFSVMTILVDEMRKYCVRNWPGGWFQRMTYS